MKLSELDKNKIQSSTTPTTSGVLKLSDIKKSQIKKIENKQQTVPEQEEKVGFWKGLLQASAKPFLETITTGAKLASGVTSLGARAVGADKVADITEKMATTEKPVSFGLLGKVQDVTRDEQGKQLSTGQITGKAIGTGVEIGSWLVGGGAGASEAKIAKEAILSPFSKQFFKKAVPRIAKEGASIGGLAGLGTSLSEASEEQGSATDKALKVGLQTTLGAGLGALFGLGGTIAGKGASEVAGIGATKLFPKSKMAQKYADKTFSRLVDSYEESLKLTPKMTQLEERWGKDTPKFLAEESIFNPDIRLKIGGDKRLDTTDAISALQKTSTEENKAFKSMLDSERKFISLEDYRAKALKDIDTPFNRAKGTEYEKMVDHINSEVDSLKNLYKDRGIIDGNDVKVPISTFNEIKQGRWATTKGFGTASDQIYNNTNFQMGHTAKNIIQDNITDFDAQMINKRLGDIASAIKILEKRNGIVLSGGRMGRYTAMKLGAIAGLPEGIGGSLAGALTGEKIAQILQSPELSNGAKRWIVARVRSSRQYQTVVEQAEKLLGKRLEEIANTKALPKPSFIPAQSYKGGESGVVNPRIAEQFAKERQMTLQNQQIPQEQKLLGSPTQTYPKSSVSAPIMMSSPTIIDKQAPKSILPMSKKKAILPENKTFSEEAQILRGTKGMTADDIQKTYPNIKLTKDVPAKDVYGNKVVIPDGEKLTPYELKDGKILLQDGQTYLVSKNQFQNIKGNTVGGEAKPFAPELEGLEETVKGASKWQGDELYDNGNRLADVYEENGKWHYRSDMVEESPAFKTRKEAMENAEADALGMYSGNETKYSQYTLPNGPLSKDTEILTNKGWKNITEVVVGDIVLTRIDDTGALEWNNVEATPRVFSEKMYHFKNKGEERSSMIDMLVTPEHNMVVKRKRRSKVGIFRVTAEKLWKMAECVIPLVGINTDVRNTKLYGLNGEDVAEFFGWYISEGYSKIDNGKKNTIIISQDRGVNPQKCDRIEGLLERLGFVWKYYGDAYGVSVKSMPKKMVVEIHKQPKSDGKFIPTFFFTQPKNVLEKLIESLILGDGCVAKTKWRKDSINYFTKSKQLAGDVQALAVLVGKKATVNQRKTGLYVVNFGWKQWADVDSAKYGIVDYNDYAYCVTVKNHAIYVRRNGKSAFTGNSNYREVLIKAPQTRLPNGITEKGGKYFDAQGTEYSKQDVFSGMKPNFKSSHWDEPNVISHLRLNERTYKGKKVTFMEELQSDWAREARKASDEVVKERAMYERDLKLLETESNVVNREAKISALKEKLEDMKSDTPKVPPIPTKDWQTLSIKRALKDAVDNNSEYFAWINGEQTSARYNLATYVDNVNWSKSNSIGEKRLVVQPKDGRTIESFIEKDGTVIASNDWSGKKLDEVLGKGLADKIMEKESGTLSGEGLKFGGEWAHNLYDKQVGNIVKDLTGAKVEVLDMGLPIEKTKYSFTNIEPSGQIISDLTASNMKVGNLIKTGVGGDYYIITDILGGGKFKAVPKSDWDKYSYKVSTDEALGRMRAIGTAKEETFDISQKTTKNQGIRLTPEIKAKIRGEAPEIKTSGKMFENTNKKNLLPKAK